MSEQGVTYSELKLPYAKKAKPGKNHPTSKKRKTTCKIIVGTICFLIVLTIAGLGYMYYKKSLKEDTRGTKENSTSSGPEVDSVVPAGTGTVSSSLVTQSYCHGRHCYYFSKQALSWNQSKKSCQNMDSSLVKIDDKEEQTFIQSKINYTYWIGLYRTESEHKWKWQDGTEPTEQLVFQHLTKMDGKCGCIKPRFIDSADCTRIFPYICERIWPFINN
ncbi:C-type lectin domain family 2 member D3-like [Ochotona princeps]|uniref:C-type lectin domain family 2 member D3-like n=1 Tax=Ochotona princeps TaxID=9978 RepID=UPI002715169B|nr:C-type lectin domain family 2 member D3-like [Ochotona princeps]